MLYRNISKVVESGQFREVEVVNAETGEATLVAEPILVHPIETWDKVGKQPSFVKAFVCNDQGVLLFPELAESYIQALQAQAAAKASLKAIQAKEMPKAAGASVSQGKLFYSLPEGLDVTCKESTIAAGDCEIDTIIQNNRKGRPSLAMLAYKVVQDDAGNWNFANPGKKPQDMRASGNGGSGNTSKIDNLTAQVNALLALVAGSLAKPEDKPTAKHKTK